MGQKTHATVFKIGTRNHGWQSKYIETVKEESFLYSFRDLDLRNYLAQFLKKKGLLLHTCKTSYSKYCLHLFISYYSTSKVTFLASESNAQQKIMRIKKRSRVQENVKENKQTNKQVNKLKFLKYYKRNILMNKLKTQQNLSNNSFVTQLAETITKFIKQHANLFVTIQSLNKGLSTNLTKKQLNSLKKLLVKFKRALNTKFFKEMLNVLVISVSKESSARFLSNFIVDNLSKTAKSKKQRFFLILLKQILMDLSKTELCKIKGIKIIVKGRLNGAPRTKKHEIIVNKVPLQSFRTKVDYHHSVSYSINGTLGVKVWIAETNHLCFYNQKK